MCLFSRPATLPQHAKRRRALGGTILTMVMAPSKSIAQTSEHTSITCHLLSYERRVGVVFVFSLPFFGILTKEAKNSVKYVLAYRTGKFKASNEHENRSMTRVRCALFVSCQ